MHASKVLAFVLPLAATLCAGYALAGGAPPHMDVWDDVNEVGVLVYGGSIGDLGTHFYHLRYAVEGRPETQERLSWPNGTFKFHAWPRTRYTLKAQACTKIFSSDCTPWSEVRVARPTWGKWNRMPGGATDVAAGPGESAWVIGSAWEADGGYGIYQWRSGEWVQVPGAAIRIDVGPDGNPWVVNARNEIYRLSAGQFTQVAGGAWDVGIGGNGSVFVVGTDSVPGGHGVYRLEANRFVRFGDRGAVRIDVDAAGNPWILDANNVIYRWNPTTRSFGSPLPGAATDIGIGANGAVWVTGTALADGGYSIHKWGGSDWIEQSGAAVAISVDANGAPIVANSAGAIYSY